MDATAEAPPESSVSPPQEPDSATTASVRTDGTRVRLGRDLTLIGVIVAVLLGGLGVGGSFLYRSLYSPAAFVEHYLDLLSTGHAADALLVAGVAIDRSEMQAAGLPKNASEALLRQSALSTLTDVQVRSERTDGDITEVTVDYRAGGYPGTTTFQVTGDGHIGLLPAWRFARSPLAVVDLTLHGSMTFQVNGFRLDKRQVALAGSEVDPADAVPMLMFTPGLYSVRVDTPISYSPGVAVLSDAPMKKVPVEVQTEPTDKFIDTVQSRVDDFLDQCATQQVLQPTGCPFGYVVRNRIDSPPTWSMVKEPKITIVPKDEDWAIPETSGVAHIVVDIRSIYDGSVHHVDQDVPFRMVGTIGISPSGAASIQIASPSS